MKWPHGMEFELKVFEKYFVGLALIARKLCLSATAFDLFIKDRLVELVINSTSLFILNIQEATKSN